MGKSLGFPRGILLLGPQAVSKGCLLLFASAQGFPLPEHWASVQSWSVSSSVLSPGWKFTDGRDQGSSFPGSLGTDPTPKDAQKMLNE